jgi:hypothetical protein
MNKIKKILFWLILVAFVGLSVWWVFYFPFNRAKLYRAIPSSAIFVSEHEKLADRWKSLAENPLMLSVLSAVGIENKDIAEIIADPVVSDMVRRFGSKDTVLAYVPSPYASTEGTWVLSSWAGPQGQLLRSGVLAYLTADLKSVRIHGGRRIWVFDPKNENSDRKWSFAVCEGLLLGCLSRDPSEVSRLIERVETGDPILSELETELGREPDKGCLDRGWLTGVSGLSGTSTPVRLRFGITACDTNALSGWVKTRAIPPDKTGILAAVAATNGLKQIIRDVPEALVILPTDRVVSLIENDAKPGYLTIVARILKREAADNGLSFACLLGTDFSGRILGIKIPAILAGVEVKDGNKALDAVVEALDKVNAKYGGSLIPKTVEVDGCPMIAVESTRSGIYQSMKSEERAAFTTRGRWLIFCSNMASLKKLISTEQMQTPKAAEWEREIHSREATAYAWVDLESTGKALQDVLAVLSLMTIVRPNSEEVAQQRKTLDSIKAVVGAASALKTGWFWLGSDGNETELQFRLGNGISTASAQDGGVHGGK